MAKAPRAPGLNGPDNPTALLDEFAARAGSPGFQNDHWGGRVIASATGPIAERFGAVPARGWLPSLTKEPARLAAALGRIGAGLARRGDRDEAVKALDEAEARIAADRVDEEAGTLAWAEVARGRHALGDEAAVDRALARAMGCNERERTNPSQARSHLAQAQADTGRIRALAELLGSLPASDIAYGLGEGAVRGVARAVATGDLEGLRSLRAVLLGEGAHILVTGVCGGVEDALRAGRHDSLFEVAEALLDTAYLSSGAAEMALVAVEYGRDAVARALVDLALDRASDHGGNLVEILVVLGDDDAAGRVREANAWDRKLGPGNTIQLGRALRLTRSRRPERFEELVAAHAARVDAMRGSDQPEQRAALGLALVAAGEGARGSAMIAEAVRDADAPPAPYASSRNHALCLLGQTLAAHDAHLPALECLKKCSSKQLKSGLVGLVAAAYARAGDPAGAAMVLGYTPATELKGLMNACDALHALVGQPGPFANYA